MASANHIIDDLGGTTKLARALGVGTSVVHGWRTSNHIPKWRQERLMALAIERGVTLSTADFPTPDERVPRQKAAA